MSNTTEDKIIVMFADHLGISPHTIKPEARLFEDLGCDSLDVMEMIMEIETDFDIVIDMGETDGVKTMGEVIGLVDRKMEARASR